MNLVCQVFPATRETQAQPDLPASLALLVCQVFLGTRATPARLDLRALPALRALMDLMAYRLRP